MKNFILFSLFAIGLCKLNAQNTIDTLYNLEKGVEAATHIYYNNTSDTILLLKTSYNDYAKDSNTYAKVLLYKVCLKNGYAKEVCRIHKNYWESFSVYGIPFDNESNRFMYGRVLDTASNDVTSKYEQVYFALVTSKDNWNSYTEKKLYFPYRKYLLHGCLKTDDGYIITGDTGKYVYSPAFVASFDFDFNLKWLKVYTFQCRYTSILKSNTGYFLSGIKDFDGAQRISQVGIDSIGNIIWERNYLDTSYYISGFLGQGVKINNKYFSYGFTSNSTNLNEIGYLNASNEDGNLLFEKFYPMQQNFSFRKMIEYNNSLYAIAALDSLINNVTFTRFVQFSKISAETGNIEWYQLYKHYSRNNEIHNLYKVDNGFLMCGNAVNQNRLKEFDSTHRIESDAWLLKVDTNGCIIPGCKPYVYSGVQHILHDNAIIEVYPNPVGEYFTITFKNQQLFNGSNEIFIYDMAGRELFNQTLKALTSSIKLQNTFNYSGAAFLVIKNDAGMFYKKIIFQ